MTRDWFERLADVDVPPLPEHFDRDVRRRVNNTLVVVQLIELATKGFFYACVEFSRPLLDLVRFTLAGTFSSDRQKRH